MYAALKVVYRAPGQASMKRLQAQALMDRDPRKHASPDLAQRTQTAAQCMHIVGLSEFLSVCLQA